MTGVRGWSFAKGHGTENDFVLVVDRENMQPVDPRPGGPHLRPAGRDRR